MEGRFYIGLVRVCIFLQEIGYVGIVSYGYPHGFDTPCVYRDVARDAVYSFCCVSIRVIG